MYSIYIACCVLLGLLLWILDLAYPRPYAGIPYSKQAAKRLLGDVPDFVKFIQSGQDPAHFGIAQCRKLNSPLIQVFLRPFSRPFIFLDDDREVEDILATRTKEFDRAPSTVGAFKPFFKHSSILKQTTSAWRAQRRLWADTMSTDFLRRVAAPKMHKYALELVELLKTKTVIARGRPFSVEEDFDLATFDIIWASVLGSDLNGVLNEHAGIQSGLDSVDQPESTDSPAVMPRVPRGQMFVAAEFFNMTMEKSLSSPFPTLQHWIWRQLPTYKRHWAVKEQIVNDLIKNARHRFAHSSETQVSGDQDTCAMDLVLRRESLAIQKSTTSSTLTPPTTAEVHDELFMFLIAGHETTATILTWSTKFLTNNPTAQNTLRAALQEAFPESSPLHLPPVEDLIAAKIPYMDATLEECVRLANITPRLVRVATVDTHVLGYHIPKGTQIMCSPYVGEAPFDIPESLRTRRCQAAKDNVDRGWGPDMSRFYPERWLDDAGNFNPRAFRRLAFSTGPRACFGKKLAMQELRVVMALLVLSFRFEAIPDALNGYQGRTRALHAPRQGYVRLTPLS
ncbi:Cytochrome P450 [Metarhizium brunneum]